MVKIMIDPGHDLNTPGKGVATMKEFEFNKEVAIRLAAHLNNHQNVEVRFSHELNDGIDQSLESRCNAANAWGADLFMSIHANAASAESASGIETFVHPNAPTATVDIASRIHNQLIRETGLRNRGLKRSDFYVLRKTKMHSVLAECGFMTNASDLAKLKSSTYREQCAISIARGIIDFYGLRLKPQPVQSPAPTAPAGTLYKVQVGAFSKKDNADRLAAELKSKGYSAIIVK